MTMQDAPAPRRRGRPKGTGYQLVDEPLWQEMHRALVERRKPTVEAAARDVAPRAYPPEGGGTIESKVARLAKGFRRHFRSVIL